MVDLTEEELEAIFEEEYGSKEEPDDPDAEEDVTPDVYQEMLDRLAEKKTSLSEKEISDTWVPTKSTDLGEDA